MNALVYFSGKNQWIEKLTNHRVISVLKSILLLFKKNYPKNHFTNFTSHNSNGDYDWFSPVANNTSLNLNTMRLLGICLWFNEQFNAKHSYKPPTNQATTTLAHSLLSIYSSGLFFSNYVKTNIFVIDLFIRTC